MGVSRGSIASAWAAELQESYAPELNILGTAVGGFIVDILAVIDTINNSELSGYLLMGIHGISREYPEIAESLDSQLIKSKAEEYYAITELCTTEAFVRYKNKDVFDYFENGGDMLSYPFTQEIVFGNSLGHLAPEIPFFVYQGLKDEFQEIEVVDQLLDKYCSNGVDVEYHRDVSARHTVEVAAKFPDAFVWFRDRLNGVPVDTGCKIETRYSNLLHAKAIEVFGLKLGHYFLNVLGVGVGPL